MKNFNPYNNFGYLTTRISRLIQERSKAKLSDLGYNIPCSCLGVLADLINQDGITQKQLGSSLIKTKSSINKMLETLEAYELIKKESGKRDARSKLIYITPTGKDLFNKVVAKDQEFTELLSRKYGKDQVLETKELLNKVYETLLEQARN